MEKESVCNHMKMPVHVRSEIQQENQDNFSKVVHGIYQHVWIFDPKERAVSFFQEKRLTPRDINKQQGKDLKFVFYAIFDGSAAQLEVFEQTSKNLTASFLNGYNCTVLAYGATGAGKTHTILGSPEDPAVMYLTMMGLYSHMEQLEEDKLCDVAVPYLEIYNEQVRDLLVSSQTSKNKANFLLCMAGEIRV